jgi:hypothetical protein
MGSIPVEATTLLFISNSPENILFIIIFFLFPLLPIAERITLITIRIADYKVIGIRLIQPFEKKTTWITLIRKYHVSLLRTNYWETY